MKPYLQTPEEAMRELQSDKNGLATREAAARLEQHGPNRLAEGKKTSRQ